MERGAAAVDLLPSDALQPKCGLDFRGPERRVGGGERHRGEKKNNDRGEGKGRRLCLGDRIDSTSLAFLHGDNLNKGIN